MKNPFVKERNNALLAGIIIGSATAAVITYLFVTEKGNSIRTEISNSFARLHDKIFGATANNNEEDHHQDYLKKPHKAPKTDRQALLKDKILSTNEAADSEE